ncbi:hypothetical protein QJS10_CPA02g00986 [Acorus calamus]|uniref:Uncharacterized protein n=1 Tax=Acorus calamus TaxID=4465 RepID=A0AAV9FC48_ACOCL|nr:hypothetical protein QJS10_CPA02g00986 [Acorus calamus]
MPPVDPETLAPAGISGGKLACETQIDDEDPATTPPPPPPPPTDSDLPPESVLLSGADELDWVDRNAVYDRDDSTKGNTNPKSKDPNPTTMPRSTSQRHSSSKPPSAPLIGLTKVEHSGYLGRSTRRTGRNRPVRPSRLVVPVGREPSSPKVSCIGKVLSGRERMGRAGSCEPVEKTRFGSGLFGSCCVRGNRRTVEREPEVEPDPVRVKEKEKQREVDEPGSGEPPGLGRVKRYSSGRRAELLWGGDVDGEDEGRVADPGAYDR